MKRLNGKFFVLAFKKAAERLLANKDEINALNVFPVPDGDTGSNMSAAILEAVEYLDKTKNEDLPEVVNAVKMGMLMGARGNSGVILSQIFRGFSEGVNGRKLLTTKAFTECLEESRKVAYKSVMKPVEGTMLTLIKELAIQATEKLEGIDEFTDYFEGLSKIAKETVRKTPQLLAKLREAGVVDAGAKGLAYIMEGFELAAKGETDVELLELSTETGTTSAEKLVDIVKEELKYYYCTELILGFGNNEKSKDEITSELKEYFNDMGDSIVVVNQDNILKIHIHTNHPGEIIEKLLNYGSLKKVKIDNMKVQHEHVVDLVDEAEEEKNIAEGKNHGLISVSPGEGLSDIMNSLGADAIIRGGQTMNPSMKNLLGSMEKIKSPSVIVLPNNPNIILTAQEAARNVMEKNRKKKITVIPTKTVQEGIAALTVYNDELEINELVKEMEEVIETVYPISVTHSIRDSSIKGKKVKKGEYIAMGRNEMIASGRRLEKVIIESLKDAVKDDEDKEIVTIFYGTDVKKEQAEKLIDSLSDKFEDLEFELHKGNQPYYYYLISVE